MTLTVREHLIKFIQQFNYEVAHWDGEYLTCFRRKLSPQYKPPYDDGSFEPFEIQEYIEDSPIDIAWQQLVTFLLVASVNQPIVVALNSDLIKQWEKEWGPWVK